MTSRTRRVPHATTPTKTLRGTLAIGPSLAVYVGEPLAVRVRGRTAAVVLDRLHEGVQKRREVTTGAHVEPAGPGRSKLAALYLHPWSHFGRIAALHREPHHEAIRGGIAEAVKATPFPKEDARDMLRVALTWLEILGLPEAKGLLDEDVQEELADYDAYLDEEGMPHGGSGLSQEVVAKLERLGAGKKLGLSWVRIGGTLRAMYSGEDREVTETRLGVLAVKTAEDFMLRSLGFGAAWPKRVISLVGATRT
jgi:hypothetical protein